MTDAGFPAGERGAFQADARRSPTLPSRYYHDPDLYRRELDKIFHRGWCYAGHRSRLPHPGDYLVTEIAGQPIFLVRDSKAGLGAFFNVCQHRGHQLLRGAGNCAGKLVCPYHAWCYGLDGKLLRAPRTERLLGFDSADFGLQPVRLAECAGLLFVNLDRDAADFDSQYPGLAQTFVEHVAELETFGVAAQYDYDIAANWKIVVDNFSEGYHIPVAHKKLNRVLDREGGISARVEALYAFYESRSRSGYDGYRVEPGSRYLSWTLWPNTCLLSLPGCANLIVLRMAPAGPERCREQVELLAPGGAQSPLLRAIGTLFADSFNAEDIAIVESVQRGLKSLGYDQGRYVADDLDGWYSESGLHRFHRLILQALEG